VDHRRDADATKKRGHEQRSGELGRRAVRARDAAAVRGRRRPQPPSVQVDGGPLWRTAHAGGDRNPRLLDRPADVFLRRPRRSQPVDPGRSSEVPTFPREAPSHGRPGAPPYRGMGARPCPAGLTPVGARQPRGSPLPRVQIWAHGFQNRTRRAATAAHGKDLAPSCATHPDTLRGTPCLARRLLNLDAKKV
jgi:hypothetical protein